MIIKDMRDTIHDFIRTGTNQAGRLNTWKLTESRIILLTDHILDATTWFSLYYFWKDIDA